MKRAHAAGQEVHKQILDLARATRSVVTAVNGEKRPLPQGARAPAPPASDPRRTPLCATLLKAAKAEPDPALRSALVRDIPALVEETLVADPEAETPIEEHLFNPRRPPPPHPRPGLPSPTNSSASNPGPTSATVDPNPPGQRPIIRATPCNTKRGNQGDV